MPSGKLANFKFVYDVFKNRSAELLNNSGSKSTDSDFQTRATKYLQNYSVI